MLLITQKIICFIFLSSEKNKSPQYHYMEAIIVDDVWIATTWLSVHKVYDSILHFSPLVSQTMVHTNKQRRIYTRRAFMAKAADVSGRLLREKGASFGSLRGWSWDILPSMQTHDFSLHPAGNSAWVSRTQQWSEQFFSQGISCVLLFILERCDIERLC